jgi:L-asparaginase
VLGVGDQNVRRPRIAFIAAGGTIDSVGRDPLDLVSYSDHGERLETGLALARVPQVRLLCEIQPLAFPRVRSRAITPDHWVLLASVIQAALDSGDSEGVVVSHGTSSLEETAYFLHLTVATSSPIVLVGAMRPPTGIGSDADANLLNAFRVAVSGEATGKGVLALVGEAIHSARDVTKTSTTRLNAFASKDFGPLGYADADGAVTFQRAVLARHTVNSEFAPAPDLALPRVDVVVSYPGSDGALIRAAAAAGARGIVSAGLGAGRTTIDEDEALDSVVRDGVVAVQASRVAGGRVVPTTSLATRGIVAAQDLSPFKARVLLMLALAHGASREDAQRIFSEY